MEPIQLSETTKAYRQEYEGKQYYSIHSPEDGVTVVVTLSELANIPEVRALVAVAQAADMLTLLLSESPDTAIPSHLGMSVAGLARAIHEALAPFEEEDDGSDSNI